jgi:glycosyltransferase involved in cell wall biosynthesis
VRLVIVSTGVVAVPPRHGGAVESYVWDLSRILAGRGHDVTLVSNRSGPAPTSHEVPAVRVIPSGSPVDRFPLNPYASGLAHVIGGTFSARATRNYVNSTAREGPGGRPQLLHLNEEISSALLARSAPDIPKILTIHNPPPSLSHARLSAGERLFRTGGALLTLRFSVPHMDRIVALSSAMKEFLVRNWEVDPQKVSVLPLPIDVRTFAPTSGSPADRKGVLYVGRLDARKNPAALLGAIHQLRNGFKVTLVGDGPLKSDLQSYVRRKALGDRVQFMDGLGTESLVRLYQSSEMLVLPSMLEACPRVVIEAAACGLPVVLQQNPIFSDFIAEGFVETFQPGTPQTLSRAILNLHEDPNRRGRFGLAAREFALRSLSYESYYSRLLEIYSGVAG